jgi:hypothetical protein
MSAVKKNCERQKHINLYTEMLTTALSTKGDTGTTRKTTDQMENIIDIRYQKDYYMLVVYFTINNVFLKYIIFCY